MATATTIKDQGKAKQAKPPRSRLKDHAIQATVGTLVVIGFLFLMLLRFFGATNYEGLVKAVGGLSQPGASSPDPIRGDDQIIHGLAEKGYLPVVDAIIKNTPDGPVVLGASIGVEGVEAPGITSKEREFNGHNGIVRLKFKEKFANIYYMVQVTQYQPDPKTPPTVHVQDFQGETMTTKSLILGGLTQTGHVYITIRSKP